MILDYTTKKPFWSFRLFCSRSLMPFQCFQLGVHVYQVYGKPIVAIVLVKFPYWGVLLLSHTN